MQTSCPTASSNTQYTSFKPDNKQCEETYVMLYFIIPIKHDHAMHRTLSDRQTFACVADCGPTALLLSILPFGHQASKHHATA